MLNRSEVKKFLAEHDLTPRRASGQNFITCERARAAVVEALADGPPRVTELGAGFGAFTQALAASGMLVRAIEQDEHLVRVFSDFLGSSFSSVDLIPGDLREVLWDWEESESYQLFGSIPYNLSGLIFRRLTELPEPPTQAVFVVQKEVGDRLTAGPPDMSLLSVAVQLWGDVARIKTVPASCFWPVPTVDSQIISITPHGKYDAAMRNSVMEVARVGFQGKRKQLAGTLSRHLSLDRAQIEQKLSEIELPTTARPQELSVKQWYALTGLCL